MRNFLWMNFRFICHSTLALTVAFLSTSAALATTLEKMSGEDLTLAADLIVVGQCTDTETRWLDRALVTYYTITVAETLKGSDASTVTVGVPGGVDLDRPVPIAVNVPGAPTLVPGDDLLLFLQVGTGSEENTFTVTGFSQGAFPVEQGAQESAWVVQKRGSRQGALPLDTVKEQIRKYLTNSQDTQP